MTVQIRGNEVRVLAGELTTFVLQALCGLAELESLQFACCRR